jgi:hypothetical protein
MNRITGMFLRTGGDILTLRTEKYATGLEIKVSIGRPNIGLPVMSAFAVRL